MYPILSLQQLPLDPDLSRRLARHLAYYHLALPIAQDEDHITVAMAHPENGTVVQVLAAVLESTVIPVRSDPREIKAALDQLWADHGDHPSASLIFWGESDAISNAHRYATALGLTLEDRHADRLETVIAQPAKLIAIAQQTPPIEAIVRSKVSILALGCESKTVPQRILQVLRGHIPDRQVLDRVAPIAHAYDAEVTLLAIASPPRLEGRQLSSDFVQLLASDHPRSAQIREYGQLLASMQIRGRRKIKQGPLDTLIVDEIHQGGYDLIAIAAEAYGDFVAQILGRVTAKADFLIIKPSE
ncbi:MAG: universal stress protein [Anaerolineae bacterium]|jgi:hypothetical protein|nr:universal stress protein [Anaerolineae bacterium]